MANGLIKDSTLTAIANAIREKTETTATMLPSEMAALIQGISGAKVTYGAVTYSKSNSEQSATIAHGLGEPPNLFVMFATSVDSTPRNILEVLMPDGSKMCIWGRSNSISYDNGLISPKIEVDAENVIVRSQSYMRGENKWLAGVV